jgi:hypothetical protein
MMMMRESAFERVTAALTSCGSRESNGKWNCPTSHHLNGDRKPGLTLRQETDRVLVRCHAGCPTEDVISALGLKMGDLFNEERKVKQEVARYPYQNEDGETEFIKVRYDPKDFMVMRPSGDYGIGDAQRILYRLPELKAAVARGEIVYVVEGEKDVDTMTLHNYTATCNFEGAGKWRDSYSSHFADAHVVIIADRDESGYHHARIVRDSLLPVVKSVRILQAAVKSAKADISDHFIAGFGIDDLVPLDGAFKSVSLGKLIASGPKEPKRIAGGMLYAGGLHCIAGAPDCGKTTIALHWAVQLLAEGKKVAFFDEEGGQEVIAEKLISLGAKMSDTENLIYVPFPGKAWDDSDVAALTEFLGEERPDLVLFDSSAAFLARAGLDENSAPAVTNWWARVLTPLARELGAAVLVIDHDTKSSEQSRYARGSGAKLAALDVQFKVEIKRPFSRQQDGLLQFTITKDRRGYLHRDWLVEVSTGMIMDLDFVHESQEAIVSSWAPAKRKVYGILSNEWQSNEKIRERLEKYFAGEKAMTRETVSTVLNELMREGYAARSGNETRALWKRRDM